MQPKVTKAVFPVAGLGTRFLPATKAMPKEMLPLIDRPLIQYAIDEAREAGIEEFIFVTARGKSALEDYFDSAQLLEQELKAKGKDDLLVEVMRSTMPSGAIAYVRQQEALGLGHAVWCARRLIGNEPFAVLLPDDVIAGEVSCLKQMVDAYQEGAMVAAMEVSREQTSSYGVLDHGPEQDRRLPVNGMVEKPEPSDAPSTMAVIGRYILPSSVMDSLDKGKTGKGGEIQLTDAIADEIAEGRPVHGFRFDGTRYDCGSKTGFLKATVAFALARDEFADEFGAFIRDVVQGRLAAE